MGRARLGTHGRWTRQRSRTSGGRSQMQGTCHHRGRRLLRCRARWHAYPSSNICRCHCRMYATAAARTDGLLLLCGGRDATGVALSDAYGFARHRDGRWEWHAAPGQMPVGRYQHGTVFVGARLHISGGAVGGGRMVGCPARATAPELPCRPRLWPWQPSRATSAAVHLVVLQPCKLDESAR
jgi:hypothetical protein